MKIIVPGKLPETRVFKATCNNCKAQIEFTQGEARIDSHRNERTFSVTCPTKGCHHIIAVDG